MRHTRKGTLESRLTRSIGVPLAGGAALTGLVGVTQALWWAGPASFGLLVLAVFVLCRA